jgi:hypothetical protein
MTSRWRVGLADRLSGVCFLVIKDALAGEEAYSFFWCRKK